MQGGEAGGGGVCGVVCVGGGDGGCRLGYLEGRVAESQRLGIGDVPWKRGGCVHTCS